MENLARVVPDELGDRLEEPVALRVAVVVVVVLEVVDVHHEDGKRDVVRPGALDFLDEALLEVTPVCRGS